MELATPRSLFKTALVLSGGSARALTHLGVLEAVQKHGLRLDLIVGTSMGAVIGALYAYYGDVAPAIEQMRRLMGSDMFLKAVAVVKEDTPRVVPDSTLNRFLWLFRRGVVYTQSMIRPTLVDEEAYLAIMSDLIPDRPIEDLSLPFAAVATDLITGDEVVLTRGSLLKAVSASAAIPGVLPPVEHVGRTLVDGGWVDNLPVAPAIHLGAHFVIAVDASLDVFGLGTAPATAVETLFRCNEISRIALNRHRKAFADVLLVPQIGDLYWANFAAMGPCLEAGRQLVEDNLERIRHKKRVRQATTLWGLLHPARRGNWRHPFVTT